MRVSFESTLAEAAEVSLVSYRDSRIYRRVHWTFGLGTALVLGFAIGTRAARTGSSPLLFGALAAATSLVVYHAFSTWALRRSLRARWRPYFREHQSLPVEIELTGEGVVYRQAGAEATYPWPDVLAAREVPGGVAVRGRNGLLALVRDRAFADAGQRALFLATVNQQGAAHSRPARG